MTDPVKTPPKKPVQFGRIPYAPIDSGALAGVNGTDAKVYCVLCAHVNRHTWTAELGRDRLATLTGLTAYTTMVATKRLEQRGLISIEVGGGRWRANRYIVHTNPLPTLGVCSAETPNPGAAKPSILASETPNPGDQNPQPGKGGTEGTGLDRVLNREKVCRPKATPDPRVQEFIQWFRDEYRRAKGRDYIISPGKDQKLVKVLLKQLSVDQMKQATSTMLADPWGGERASIGLLSSQINTWRGSAQNTPSRGKFTPASPGTDYDSLTRKFETDTSDGIV